MGGELDKDIFICEICGEETHVDDLVWSERYKVCRACLKYSEEEL